MVAICFTLGGCTADDQESGSSVAILGPEAERNAETGTFPFILSPTDTTVHPVLSGTFDGENPGDEPEVVPIMVQVLDPPPPGLDVEDVAIEFSFRRPFGGPDTTTNVTGGHNHPMGGDTLPERPRGRFIASGITPNDFEFRFEEGDSDSTLVVFADATGQIVVPYQSSGIGGIEKVYLEATDIFDYVAAPTWDSVVVTLRIGSFEGLTGSTVIALVGQTGTHPSNHWATQETNGYVETVAEGMSMFFPGIQLEVNDMNLEFGGIFDCAQPDSGCPGPNNPWGPPHETHKVGIQVDFNLDNDPEPARSDTARRFRLELGELPIDAKVWDRETSHHHVTFCPATGEVDGFVIDACP